MKYKLAYQITYMYTDLLLPGLLENTKCVESYYFGQMPHLTCSFSKPLQISNGIAVTRPPGHHAERNCPQGFCIFNHVPIAVKHVQKKFNVKKYVNKCFIVVSCHM